MLNYWPLFQDFSTTILLLPVQTVWSCAVVCFCLSSVIPSLASPRVFQLSPFQPGASVPKPHFHPFLIYFASHPHRLHLVMGDTRISSHLPHLYKVCLSLLCHCTWAPTSTYLLMHLGLATVLSSTPVPLLLSPSTPHAPDSPVLRNLSTPTPRLLFFLCSLPTHLLTHQPAEFKGRP